jgi:hypothetical protein
MLWLVACLQRFPKHSPPLPSHAPAHPLILHALPPARPPSPPPPFSTRTMQAMAVPFSAVSLLVPYWSAHFGAGVWPQFLAAYNVPAVFVLAFQQAYDSKWVRRAGAPYAPPPPTPPHSS